MIKVGVVGGTGYTGVELLRLLVQHSAVELKVVTSRSEQGRMLCELFPNLRGATELRFSAPDSELLRQCDLVFFATPNGVAMQQVPELLAAGVRVIDLAADFRLNDEKEWQHWYGQPHHCPELLDEAVYGLPEWNRKRIQTARLVANPGCYPTAVQLGLLPLLVHGVVPDAVIADCKSGTSGAGRGAQVGALLAEAGESLGAYGVSGHRHHPEISQGLQAMAGRAIELTFVPHLTPMIRGIHATLYAQVDEPIEVLQERYQEHYQSEPFVDLLPAGSHLQTRSVRGSNFARVALHKPGKRQLVVLVVIDNLVKGAAGQAIQNMNLMFGLAETSGLEQVALLP